MYVLSINRGTLKMDGFFHGQFWLIWAYLRSREPPYVNVINSLLGRY